MFSGPNDFTLNIRSLDFLTCPKFQSKSILLPVRASKLRSHEWLIV